MCESKVQVGDSGEGEGGLDRQINLPQAWRPAGALLPPAAAGGAGGLRHQGSSPPRPPPAGSAIIGPAAGTKLCAIAVDNGALQVQ